MSSPDVVVIIVDQNINLLTIPYATNYTFPSTKVVQYPGESMDSSALKTAINLLSSNLNLSIDNSRLYDISLINDKGEKLYVYICKLNSLEVSYIRYPKFEFININRLPNTLNLLSSGIAVTLTNYFDLIRLAEPKVLILNYPSIIVPFVPIINVPIYRPIRTVSSTLPITTTAPKVPRKNTLLEHQKIDPLVVPKHSSPRTKPSSPKSPRSPKAPRPPSPKAPRPPSPKSLPVIHKIPLTVRKISPIKPKKPSNSSDTSSVSSTKSRKKKDKKKKEGGYYSKYLKYKIKYLESEKQVLYLTEKINKYNSI